MTLTKKVEDADGSVERGQVGGRLLDEYIQCSARTCKPCTHSSPSRRGNRVVNTVLCAGYDPDPYWKVFYMPRTVTGFTRNGDWASSSSFKWIGVIADVSTLVHNTSGDLRAVILVVSVSVDDRVTSVEVSESATITTIQSIATFLHASVFTLTAFGPTTTILTLTAYNTDDPTGPLFQFTALVICKC